MWKAALFFLLFAFSNAQTFDRVILNYPSTNNPALLVDYNYNSQAISRSALIDTAVAQLVIGALNLVTPVGYVTADNNNLWSYQIYSITPPQYQLVAFSHSTCLGEYFGEGPTPISALALDPTNSQVYVTYETAAGVNRFQYDGAGTFPITYPQSATAQLVFDYNGRVLYFLPSAGSVTFNYLNLLTNASGQVTAPNAISGGLAVDIGTGNLYVATTSSIVSWSPTSNSFATVFTNANLVFRGIALDASNNLLFFVAENTIGTSSALYATPLSSPGTLTTLHTATPKEFATVAVVQCTSSTCGNCGASTSDATTVTSVFSLMLLAVLLAF